jgi:hypothetical protein
VPTVWFVDTSVLVNLLDLDGFNQDKKAVADGLKQRLDVKEGQPHGNGRSHPA